jgi:hypothetical protein
MSKERTHEVGKEPKSILLSHPASSRDGEDSFDEALSVARLIPKADFTPLNGGPDRSLGRVVGWLDTLDAQKGEKHIPVLDKTGGASPNVFVGGFAVAQAGAFHAPSDQGGGLPQLFAGATGLLESVPVAEKRPGLL